MGMKVPIAHSTFTGAKRLSKKETKTTSTSSIEVLGRLCASLPENRDDVQRDNFDIQGTLPDMGLPDMGFKLDLLEIYA